MRLFLVLGLMVGLTGVTTARGEEGGKGPGKGNREEFQKRLLEKFDADKDGKLSDAEKATAKEAFAKRQAEGGKGGKGEKGRGKGGPGAEKFREQMIARFDKDKDGKLSEDEKAAAKEAFAKRKGEKGDK